jgi:hypothetical protein
MAATTIKTKREPEQVLTFEQLAEKRLREKLEQYRAYVSKTAAGAQLPEEELSEVLELLEALELPQYAWDRDVEAARRFDRVRGWLNEAETTEQATNEKIGAAWALVQKLEQDLRSAREQHRLAQGKQMKRVGKLQTFHELNANHPHLFWEIDRAVAARLESRAQRLSANPA